MTTTTSGSPATRSRLPLFGLLVVLLLCSVGATVWGLVDRGGSDDGGFSSGESGSTTREREEVMASTEQFVLRMGTYGPKDLDDKGKLPGYRTRVKEVITTKFGTSFEEAVEIAEQMVAQFALQRTAAVYGTGVATLDDDSATALVAGSFTDRFGKAEADDPRQFRWEVRLVKVKGEWLVDDYSAIGGTTK